MKRSEKRTPKAAIISIILLCIAAALLFAAKNVRGFAEWYSVNIYSLITASIGRLAGTVPFSIAEAASCILLFSVIVDIMRCRKRLRAAFMHIFLIVSILFFLYAANCGINYHRNTFVDQKALSGAEFTEDQLADFCEYITVQIKECVSATDYPHGRDFADAARLSMSNLSENYPSLRGYYPYPKQLSFLSRAFSSMGVSGIYSPLL